MTNNILFLVLVIMKKIVVIVLLFLALITCQKSEAQDVGLGKVIFEQANIIAEKWFFINELSYIIITLHLGMAGKNIQGADYVWESLMVTKKLEELSKTNIIEVLSLSIDKEKALTSYLTDCEKELQKWDTLSTYLRQEMNVIKWDMEACIAEKNISDKAYFDAVDRYDQNIMQDALTTSIKYEICAAQNRIQYNAKVSIAQKLVFYLGVLQRKYDVLFKKQEILAKNFDIFRDWILPDLNEIDQLLKQYQL